MIRYDHLVDTEPSLALRDVLLCGSHVTGIVV